MFLAHTRNENEWFIQNFFSIEISFVGKSFRAPIIYIGKDCFNAIAAHAKIGPQHYNNPSRENKLWLPIRSVVCRTGDKKGINKKPGAAPAYKLHKTTKIFPPESEIRNIQTSGKKQNRNKIREASETIIGTNGRERETGGQVETLYSLRSATRNGEAITLGIGIRGR